MGTIKIPVKTTTTNLIEVSLPIYRQDHCHAYKVFSENQCISVMKHYSYSEKEHNGGIDIVSSSLAWNSDKTIDCTEQDFMEAFERTVEAISELASETVKEKQV